MSTATERHEMWARMFDRLGPAAAILEQLVDVTRTEVVDVVHVLGSEGEACLQALAVAAEQVRAVRSHAAEQSFVTAREIEAADRLRGSVGCGLAVEKIGTTDPAAITGVEMMRTGKQSGRFS